MACTGSQWLERERMGPMIRDSDRDRRIVEMREIGFGV